MKQAILFSLLLIYVHQVLSQSLPQGFVYLNDVDPSIHQQIDFATDSNCIGIHLEGYDAPKAIMTAALAKKLREVQIELVRYYPGYSLLVLDAYRPVKAVEHIKKWAADLSDQKTKIKCYPDIDKKELLGKYVALGKSSHSRGSTVDIIIMDIKTKLPLDFGPDYFGKAAHINYSKLTEEQKKYRMMLRDLMLRNGFKPYDEEYWHFTLGKEPFPNTYFDFTIK